MSSDIEEETTFNDIMDMGESFQTSIQYEFRDWRPIVLSAEHV